MGYRGSILELPVAIDGMYGSKKVPIVGLREARNLVFENDAWEKEGGAVTQNATALASGIAVMVDWWPSLGNQRFIAVTKGGGAYRDAGPWTFPTTLFAEGTLSIVDRSPQLLVAGREAPGSTRKLFLFTGRDEVRVGAGDFTTMPVIDPVKKPADWAGTQQPSCAVIHEGRLWAFLEGRAYFSAATDHEDFRSTSGGGFLTIALGQAERIVAAVSVRKMLVAFGYPAGIWIIDTSSVTTSNWRLDPQSHAVGTAGPYGAIAIPNDALIVNPDLSIHLLSATAVERDAEASNISRGKFGEWIRGNLNPDRAGWVQAVWYSDKHRAEIACAGTGETKNSRKLLLDLGRPTSGVRWSYSDRDVCDALTTRKVSGVDRPYAGTDAGKILRLDDATRSKDGAGYVGLFRTADSDLGELQPEFKDRPKRFDFAEFEYEGLGDVDLLLNVYIDGQRKTATSLAVKLTGTGVPLGTFKLDVDRLASSDAFRKRKRLFWQGTRISLEGSVSGPGETFKALRCFVGARLAG